MIHIIADTTCSLPLTDLAALRVPVLPQMIIFGQDTYRDDTEIDTDTFLNRLRGASSLPKTSAPAPALYEPVYRACAGQGDTLLVITPSAEVSGTYRAASVAAQDFPNEDIRVIDSRTVAGGLGQLVLQAAAWAAAGMAPDAVEAAVRAMAAREQVYFIVDTLEYLYKGGRIGGAKALFGSLLQIKPILTISAGRIDAVESQRTKKRAVARVQELTLRDCPPGPDSHLTITHCGALEEAQEAAAFFRSALNLSDVPIYITPPAIVVHAGPKVLSVSYFRAC